MFGAILALTVAFPAAGQKLPFVEKAYMIGAVPRATSNLVVQGRTVDVYRTGAWATMVDVVEGTNTVQIAVDGTVSNHVFQVAFKPKPKPPAHAEGGGAAQPKSEEKKWTKLEYLPDEPKPHPAGRQPGELRIVLDPGHGGADTGAISPHGLYEKNANLLQTVALKAELEKRGYKVFMTREDDRALVLAERPRLTLECDADLFVSIHHNAPGANQDAAKARYTAVYSWNPLGEALSAAIAKRMEESFADEMPSKGSLHANFAVTRNPQTPSCLVEVDFITSPVGEECIFNNDRRQRVACAVADGIEDWARAAP